MRALRVVFIVQGEGRGHLTQALALAGLLKGAGHSVEAVAVGCNPHRALPPYFATLMDAPVVTFEAPTMVPDRAGVGISTHRTVIDFATRLPRFARSLRRLRGLSGDADVVVNFLDPLGGLATVLGPSVPVLAVAHHHAFAHPTLAAVPHTHERRTTLGYARISALGAALRAGLSFDSLPEVSAGGKLVVVPPLLRSDVTELQPTDEGFLLVYALNPGYGRLVQQWQRGRPEVPVRCYVEGGDRAVAGDRGSNFEAMDLDAHAFVRDLARCRAYAGSAGFESICEAFYLGKPVLAIPTPGHVEQKLNAWDAARVGAARPGDLSDLDDFWSEAVLPDSGRVMRFRGWVESGPRRFIELVEAVAEGSPDPASARPAA